MYKKTRWGFTFLALLVALGVWVVYEAPIKYGIDLRGGTLLVYSLDLSRIEEGRSSVAEEVKDIIARRLNTYGLKEISVQVQGEDHLLVRLPGTDPQAAEDIKRQIRTAGNLTFRLVSELTEADFAELVNEERAYLDADTRWVKDKIAAEAAGRTFSRERPEPPREIVRSEVPEGDAPPPRYALSNDHVYNDLTGDWDHGEGIVSGSYLTRVLATVDSNFRPAVSFEFQGEGARKFGDLTGNNQGRSLAILLDDDVMQVATIRSQITTRGELTGDYTTEEVNGVVNILRGGSLRTKPQLESESTVGSALGQDSINASVQAMLFAFAAVLLFMAFYYMAGGCVADVALVLNVFFIIVYVKLFRQDLTLPGIAGVLLTIGMAVDANILIYERVREERKRGKSLQRALSAGYQRAFWVIFDSNITTLLTGIVLFNFGTGPVRGFAVTLISGIIASFFTSIFVTRLILSFLLNIGLLKELKMQQLFNTPRIPFVAKQKTFFMVSMVAIALSWVLVISRGQDNFGIDFNGGAQISVNLNRSITVPQMREIVDGLADEHPDLFLDYNLQTIGTRGRGESSSYILLTRTRLAQESVANAQETPAAPDGAATPPGAPAAASAGAAVAPAQETPAISSAERVRQVLEQDLRGRGLLLPAAFASSDWENDSSPGAPAGSYRFALEVNLVATSTALTTDKLKSDLNALLASDPLLAGNPDDAGAEFAGIRVDGVELVKKDDAGVSTYRVRTSAYQPPPPGSTLTAVPTQQQVDEAIRIYFNAPPQEDGEALFRLSEPFSQVDTVSGTVARTLQTDAIIAIFISMLGIVFYISLRFEFIFGLAAVTALVHDILIALGAAAVADHFFSGVFPVKINLTEVAAILTIIGFSINDTIVIFDRIRENLQILGKRKVSFADVIDMSINQTLARTIWTSLTTLFVVVMLLGFGGVAVRGFAFIFCVGIVSGTYSTIFIAGPVVIWLHDRAVKRREEAAQAVTA